MGDSHKRLVEQVAGYGTKNQVGLLRTLACCWAQGLASMAGLPIFFLGLQLTRHVTCVLGHVHYDGKTSPVSQNVALDRSWPQPITTLSL
jgi:hypothetical protein